MDNEGYSKKSLIPALENQLNTYLVQKAPFQLPENVRAFIVTISPWLIAILLFFTLPIILGLLGLATVLAPISVYTEPTWGPKTIAILLFAVAELILYAVALPGLFKKTKAGWNFVFYACLISSVDNLVRLNYIGFVFGTLVGLYVLFQVRSYYR